LNNYLACECEHAAHFDRTARTPNGNPGHDYGVGFAIGVKISTPYGTFRVCESCARDCHSAPERVR
jgi:hypothetical protein